jgi:hypothetical protein
VTHNMHSKTKRIALACALPTESLANSRTTCSSANYDTIGARIPIQFEKLFLTLRAASSSSQPATSPTTYRGASAVASSIYIRFFREDQP